MHPLLRPRALVGHVLVLAVVVTCVALGQWQLSRLADVREVNSRLQQQLAEQPVALAELDEVPAAASPADEQRLRELEFRMVHTEGVWRPDQEVLQRNREHLGSSGYHVLTPLELGDGRVLLVRRGWVPSTLSTPPVVEARPAHGVVRVTGVLERPVSQPSFGPQDPDEGSLQRVFHTDTSRLDRQIDGELVAMVLRMSDVDPAHDAELPLALGDPELDERNHLSYAVQWYVFALLALVIYGVWLRQASTQRDERQPRAPQEASAASPSPSGGQPNRSQ